MQQGELFPFEQRPRRSRPAAFEFLQPTLDALPGERLLGWHERETSGDDWDEDGTPNSTGAHPARKARATIPWCPMDIVPLNARR